MKHLLKPAIIAGLAGMIGAGAAFAQLPPNPSKLPTLPTPVLDSVPTPVEQAPAVDSLPLLPPHEPEALPSVESQPIPAQPTKSTVPPYYGGVVVPGIIYGPNAWQSGGYEPRMGRPYYYTTPGRNQPLYSVHQTTGTPWAFDHSAYHYHFGPGYYRRSEGGTYRFPYYSYRAPWYFPGHPIYNRDTNRPW